MLMDSLNEKQREAVMTTDGPLLMLAGAGSGKTHCLVCRVAHLIESGVVPERILLLTFTNKAAREMMERVEAYIPGTSDRVTACTYHSFCAKMLRHYGIMADIDPNFVILDTGDSADIIGMMKTEMHLDKVRGLPPNKKIASIISASINKQKPISEIMSSGYKKYVKTISDVEVLKTASDEYKKKNNLMDYDDILLKFRDMLRDYPEIRKKIADLFEYIMVDEYQDTNKLQDEILFYLRENNKNLAVVGDDSQILYGFRGADVYNIINFPDKMDDCTTVPLMQNYRSTQEILDVANYAINKCATEGYKKKLVSNNKHGEKPFLVMPDDPDEEAAWIFHKIKEELSQGVPANEICVLARNSSELYMLEALLSKAGIEYEKYGGLKFLDKAHIKDILAYLRLVTNQHDEISWYRILKLYIGIGPVYAKRIAGICVNEGYEGLKNNPYSKKTFYKSICKLQKLLLSCREKAFHDFLPVILNHYIETRKEVADNMKTDANTRAEILEQLQTAEEDFDVLSYMAESYDDCIDFLDALSLDNHPALDKDGDKLVLSTIHSAKGLEYHTVFIMDCIDEVFPFTTWKDKGSKEDNEELRCFYVAVTRAKETLYIMAPNVGLRWGNIIGGNVSHFIKGAEDLFEVID